LKAYMDNASGAPVDPRVLQEILPFLTEHVGNPSSFHSEGFKALKAMNKAGVKPELENCIDFVSCLIFYLL